MNSVSKVSGPFWDNICFGGGSTVKPVSGTLPKNIYSLEFFRGYTSLVIVWNIIWYDHFHCSIIYCGSF